MAGVGIPPPLEHCNTATPSSRGVELAYFDRIWLVASATLQLEGEHGYRQENLAAFAPLDSHSRHRSQHRHLVHCTGACQCRRRRPLSSLICPIPVLPLSAKLSVLSAATASLLAGPQLYTSTELYASGGPVGRQHRQTIEPTGAEQLAGSASQPTAVSILSTAAALLKDVRGSGRVRKRTAACREMAGSPCSAGPPMTLGNAGREI